MNIFTKFFSHSAAQPANLITFQEFITTAEERYHQQIIIDHEGLRAVLTILENLTRTINTLVNIERTKVESQQNTTISIAGLGLAASSSVASLVSTQVRQTKDADSSDRIPVELGFVYILMISLGIVVVGVVGAIGLRELLRKLRK